MNEIKLIHGDCLDEMPKLEAGSIDLVLADIPYGTTQCRWDSIIPFTWHILEKGKVLYIADALISGFSKEHFEENKQPGMWESLNRIIKKRGAIVLFGSEPFSSTLRMSNIKDYKYDWIWNKVQKSNFLNAKRQPLRKHELISVFYRKQCTYNFIKTKGHVKKEVLNIQRVSVDLYNDQYGVSNYSSTERYPASILRFPKDTQKSSLHPTQKPVALMEYLIRTYTDEGETVLDFTMGSGTTGVGCKNTGRNFIGIEKDPDYFKIAEERLALSKFVNRLKEEHLL